MRKIKTALNNNETVGLRYVFKKERGKTVPK